MNKTVVLDGLSSQELRHPVLDCCIGTIKELNVPHKVYQSWDDMGLCLACNFCNEKTIGVCFRKDKGSEMIAHLSQADLFVILTQVRYGTYDPYVKKALDRIAILGSPYFEYRDKQMFHKGRTDNRLNLLVIALSERESYSSCTGEKNAELVSKEERESFEVMIQRTSEHFNSNSDILWVSPQNTDLKLSVENRIKYMFGIHERKVI